MAAKEPTLVYIYFLYICQIATTVIKDTMVRNNVKRGEQIKMRTRGNSLNVTAGTPTNPSRRNKPISCLGVEAMGDLAKRLGLATVEVKEIVTTLRASGLKVEEKMTEKVKELERQLDEYYEVVTIEMEEISFIDNGLSLIHI